MSATYPNAALVAELRGILKLEDDDDPAVAALGGVPRAFERFLIAHHHNLDATATAMRATLAFRRKHALDAIGPPDPALAKVAPHWPGGLATTSADGRGVYYFGYGHLFPRALMRSVSEEELLVFYLDFMDRVSQQTTDCNPPNTSSAQWKGPIEVT